MSARRIISAGACGPLAIVVAVLAAADASAVTVAPNVQVNKREPGQLVQDYKSPSVAINPSDPSNIVVAFRHDDPDYYCFASYSLDGGKSWHASQLPTPPAGTCWSPAVAFGEGNHVYFATQDRPPGGGNRGGLVYASQDGGRTFGAPVRVTQGDAPGWQLGVAVDRSAAHPGRVYATWYDIPPGLPYRIMVAFSDDRGASWSTPRSAEAPGDYQYLPSPAVGPDGTLYVVYKDIGLCLSGRGVPHESPSQQCPVRVLRSSDGGQTFTRHDVATAIYDDLAAGEQPGIVVAPNGDLLVTFASMSGVAPAPGCARDLDAFVARSTDRGESWSAPVRVNDDPCASGAAQRDPWISVAPNGRVDAIFYDARRDPNPGDASKLYDAYYASSFDAGQSFGPNVRASARSFDLTVMLTPKSSGFQSKEFDQQNGIVSTDAGAIAAWGDTRNAPAGESLSDVFSARIGLGSTGPGPDGGGIADRIKPVLSDLRPRPRSFRAAKRGASIAARVGSNIRYRLSEPAVVRFTVDRTVPGRRVDGRCRRPTRQTRRAKRCLRYVPLKLAGRRVGFSHPGRRNFNSLRFTGRLDGRKLAPRRYRLAAVATDPAGNRSRTKRARFRIVG